MLRIITIIITNWAYTLDRRNYNRIKQKRTYTISKSPQQTIITISRLLCIKSSGYSPSKIECKCSYLDKQVAYSVYEQLIFLALKKQYHDTEFNEDENIYNPWCHTDDIWSYPQHRKLPVQFYFIYLCQIKGLTHFYCTCSII